MHPLIRQLDLQPHPEGGFYKEVYRSSQIVNSPANQQPRNTITSIYFLLLQGQISRFHKVLHDETWHFYSGAPLKLIDLYDKCDEHILGDDTKPDFQHTIVANHWQAAETMGDYSLMGCTVAPGFDFNDFSFLSDDKENAENVQESFPQYARFI